jgi:hypothetical protein
MTFTTTGVVFMLVAWGLVLGLAVYCYCKMFSSDKADP